MRYIKEPAEWLQLLQERKTKAHLKVCRYHCRQGIFRGGEQILPENLVTLVEQGELQTEVDGKKMAIGTGEVLWLPPGTRRCYYSEREKAYSRIYNLRFSICRKGDEIGFSPAQRRIGEAWDMLLPLQQLYSLYMHGHTYNRVHMRALLLLVSTSFLELCQHRGKDRRGLSHRQCLQLNRHIAENINTGITPTALAEECNLSLDYFSRLFRNTYGMAPRMYLKHERMRISGIRLRETSLTVSQVAREFGIDNDSLFCRQFREVFGCTPSAYRQQPAPVEET